jgi:replicative DNA helicase
MDIMEILNAPRSDAMGAGGSIVKGNESGDGGLGIALEAAALNSEPNSDILSAAQSSPALNKEREAKQDPYRTPPCNLEAERMLIGAVLLNNEGLNQFGDFLRAEHFYEPVHQRIYSSIERLVDRGLIANPVTLKNYFDEDEALKDIGGSAYLVKLAALADTIINVRYYAQDIYDLALKRQLIGIGSDIVNTAYDYDIDQPAPAQIEFAEQKLFNLASAGSSERGYEHLTKSVTAAIHRVESAFRNQGKVSGISTGLVDMDRLLGGMQRSDLIILAGRPSMGKTALATNIAFNAAKFLMQEAREELGDKASKSDIEKATGSVAFFSLEMSSEQLASRLISGVTNINSTRLRRGELNDDDFSELVRGSQELSNMPFFIDDTPALSISALRTRARRMKRMHNLAFIVVDYLQLMRSTSEMAKQNRVLEISDITQGLKAIAKELNVPVMALSQLSRAVEQREDKRPQLSDLRESGTIEQDADVVVFVFREEYYLSRKMPREGTNQFAEWQLEMERVHGLAEAIIAKQRNGPVGTARLAFHGDTTKFSNLATDNYPPAGIPTGEDY